MRTFALHLDMTGNSAHPKHTTSISLGDRRRPNELLAISDEREILREPNLTRTQPVIRNSLLALSACLVLLPGPVRAEYRQTISNDLNRCKGDKPSVLVTVEGVKSSSGKIRVQSYRANGSEWLEKSRWLSRIEVPARTGTMTFCLPLPTAGSYGIAVRHDVDGNGGTDLAKDGGGMSNNPALTIFNLGRPSFKKTAIEVGEGAKSIRVKMRYM